MALVHEIKFQYFYSSMSKKLHVSLYGLYKNLYVLSYKLPI